MESDLLTIEPYLTITKPQRNAVDVQLRGGDPEPTAADILGYYMAKLEQLEHKNLPKYPKVEAWMQSIENEWEEHMEEVKSDINKVAAEKARDLSQLTDVVRCKVQQQR